MSSKYLPGSLVEEEFVTGKVRAQSEETYFCVIIDRTPISLMQEQVLYLVHIWHQSSRFIITLNLNYLYKETFHIFAFHITFTLACQLLEHKDCYLGLMLSIALYILSFRLWMLNNYLLTKYKLKLLFKYKSSVVILV